MFYETISIKAALSVTDTRTTVDIPERGTIYTKIQFTFSLNYSF